MSAARGIGSFLSGFSGGYKAGKDILDDEKKATADEKPAPKPGGETVGQDNGGGTAPPPTGGPTDIATAASGRGSGKVLTTSDPVATDMAPYQRAFLNAIAGGESGGAYNIRYTPRGGAYFDDLSQHPGIFEDGPHGKSSAAGRYQFTKTTWDGLGGGDFSPASQDARAWQLASSDYKSRTGRDLGGDLRQGGLSDGIMSALTPTWQALKGNRASHAATYNDSLSRFAAPSQAAAAAESPAPAGKTLPGLNTLAKGAGKALAITARAFAQN